MGKYTTKITDEEGNVKYLASDGKEYKSSGAAHKHSIKLEDLKEINDPGREEPERTTEQTLESENEPDTGWATFDWGEETGTVVVPSILKKIKPVAHEGRGKKSKKALEAERSINLAVLTTGYKASDLVLTKYRRVMMEDDKATAITHSEEDYVWISDVTNSALEHNGISIGAAIGPNQVALIANGYWFGSEIHRIHKESDKSPFKGKIGGTIKRILKRVPIIGKRIKKAERANIERVLNDDSIE